MRYRAMGLALLLGMTACGGGGTAKPPAVPAPTIRDMTPSGGSVRGGLVVLILGEHFMAPGAGANEVRFGGVAASAVVTLDDERIQCVTPPGPAGQADVEVRNAHGTALRPRLYDYVDDIHDVAVESDTPGASYGYDPQVCCSGGIQHVVWADERSGTAAIRYNRSTDQGAMFDASDVLLSEGSTACAEPRICCSGAYVYVAWSQEAATGGSDIWFNASLDGGLTWLPETLRLDRSPTGQGESTDISICCDGANVNVAWNDTRAGVREVYVNGSIDAGETWFVEDVLLGRQAGSETHLCCWNTNVYAAWHDEVPMGETDVFFNRSHDNGATWLQAPIRLDQDDPGESGSRVRDICCDTNTVHVLWLDDRDNRSIYMRSSTDAGDTWPTDEVRVGQEPAPDGSAGDAQLCCFGQDTVRVVWGFETIDGHGQLRFNQSFDRGVTWQAQDTLIYDDVGISSPSEPRICCTGDSIFVAWLGNGGYYDVSPDGGETWTGNEPPLEFASVGGGGWPDLCCDGGRGYIVWSDARNGSDDVFCTVVMR